MTVYLIYVSQSCHSEELSETDRINKNRNCTFLLLSVSLRENNSPNKASLISCSHRVTQSLRYCLSQSLSHLATKSVTQLLCYPVIPSLSYSLCRSITHLLNHSVTRSLSHLVNQSRSHSFTESLTYSLTFSLTASLKSVPRQSLPIPFQLITH